MRQTKKPIPAGVHVTYQYQRRKCGKSNCKTCQNSQGHGEYWYAYYRLDGKLHSHYIGKKTPVGLSQEQLTRLRANATRRAQRPA